MLDGNCLTISFPLSKFEFRQAIAPKNIDKDVSEEFNGVASLYKEKCVSLRDNLCKMGVGEKVDVLFRKEEDDLFFVDIKIELIKGKK